MKRLFKFKYPKLLILALSIIAAYFIFTNPFIIEKLSRLNSLSYHVSFIAGLLYAIGFTSPIAVGFFLTASPANILAAALLGGLGAMLADLLIFKIIRISFMDEFTRLEKTKPLKEARYLMDKYIGHHIKIYLLYGIAGIIIASPLADEIGVIMLAGLTKIKPIPLAIISYIMNSLGILVILLIGAAI